MDNINHIKNENNKGEDRDILQNSSLKQNPFTVPQGYFNTLKTELNSKIHSSDKGSTPSFASLRTTVAMAAMFALVFGLGYGVLYITNTHTNYTDKQNTTALTGSDVIESSDTHSEAISDEELLQYFGNYQSYSQEEIESIDVITNPVNKDEIEQYLIDTNVPSLTVLAALDK